MNKNRFWLLGIILIALALRCYNLTYHSLWFDEAMSVHWARQSVPRIIEVGFTLVEDRLPPLYYLTLKGWTALVGFSETGVRSLSVFCGVLLAPVMAAIALMLFNRRVAYATALLVALNPFLIWYAQEARMYAPAALLSALTVWAFLQICKLQIANCKSAKGAQSEIKNFIPHPSSFILHPLFFILFAIAGLYTHLYTGFVLPALGLWLVVSYPRAWRAWLLFAASGLIITLAFAPLAIATWRFSGESTPGDLLTGLGGRVWWLLQSFTVWKAPLSPTLQTAIPVIFTLLALCAYLPNYKLQTTIRYPLLLTTLLFITPFLIASLLLLRNHLAFFGERYFIVMTPWLLLLAAVGAEKIANGKWQIANRKTFILHPLSFILLLLDAILPLPGQWSLPAAKEAWRQSAAYLATHAQPDDAILIHPDWVRYPFQFYYNGPGQTYAAFSTVTPATALDGPLQGVVAGHPVIWLIESHLDAPDPERRVEQWLAARYPLVTEVYPPGIILKAYAPGYQLDSLPPAAAPVDMRFDNGLRLAGYQADATASATDDLFHPPSGWVHVVLYWDATRPVADDAAPFVHLVGPAGVWGASLERPNDAFKLYPPSRWSAGNKPIIRHDVDVNLNPATPPGRYQLVVGLAGQQYPLTQVEIR